MNNPPNDLRYYDVQKFAWECKIKPAGRKLVLICLAFHSDNFGSSFPHIRTIAEETNQGESTVKDHLKNLENDGYISRERQRYENGYLAGYRYFINVRTLDVGISPRSEVHDSYVRTSDHYKDQLKTKTISIPNYGLDKIPISDNWEPDETSIQRMREAKFTKQEAIDCIVGFIEYWKTQARTVKGKKNERYWQVTFRNNVATLEKRHSTRYRRETGTDPKGSGSYRGSNSGANGSESKGLAGAVERMLKARREEPKSEIDVTPRSGKGDQELPLGLEGR